MNSTEETSNALQQASNAVKNIAKKAIKVAAKSAGIPGFVVDLAESATKVILILSVTMVILIAYIVIALHTNAIGISTNPLTHLDSTLHDYNDFEVEQELNQTDIETEDKKYAELIVAQMVEERHRIDDHIKTMAEQKGIDFNNSIIIDNTYIPTIDSSSSGGGSADAIVAWARERAEESPGKWYYVYYGSSGVGKNGVPKSTQCPICYPRNGKAGWQCIGFVSAAYFHGGGVPVDIHRTHGKYCHYGALGNGGDGNGKGSLDGPTPDDVYRKWKSKNGDNWEMITSGNLKSGHIDPSQLQPGDALICYDEGGNSVHMALYAGDNKIIHCSSGNNVNGGAGGVMEGPYENSWTGKRCRVAMRYTGGFSGGASMTSGGTAHSASDVVNGACAWAEAIAADDSFHYGHGGPAHHGGCYFCKTQPKVKQAYLDWEKSYCCNPFVFSSFAHGGGDADMMKMCKKGKNGNTGVFKDGKHFKDLGKPAFSSLQKGDVLWYNHGDQGCHYALYLGNGKLAEAAGSDDNKRGSKKWKNSIHVRKITGYGNFEHASRYIGSGGGVMELPSGSGGTASYTAQSSYTELQSISPSTGSRKQIGYISGTSANCAQSFAYVNDKFAVAFVNTDKPPCYVGLYSKEGKKLDHLKNNSNGHSNGSTATPENTLLVTPGSTDKTTVAQEFEISDKVSKKGTKSIPVAAQCIAFDKETKKYIIRKGMTFYVYDENFSKLEKSFSDNITGHSINHQDMGASNGYVFVCSTKTKGGEQSGYNYIDIFNETSGEYCGSYTVTYGELESADVVDGELVLLVHIIGYKNYIQYTGIKVGAGNGGIMDDTVSRDVAAAIAAFSTYESEILPPDPNAELDEPSAIGKLIMKLKDKFRRDVALPLTLRSILHQNRLRDFVGNTYTPGLLRVDFSNVVEKNGKKTAVIEINHQDGEGLANFFYMKPQDKYTTESEKTNSVSDSNRQSGEDYEIGDASIEEAIETNTDTHMALLYDSINGAIFNKSVLCLPLKKLFTKIDLSKTFADDGTGIECEPKSGTKVYSCERGDVIAIGENDEKLGNYIVIQGYYRIVYAHLDSIKVQKGDLVKRNSQIGTSTNVFRLEIYDEGTAVDPEPLFIKKIAFGKDYTGIGMFAGGGSNVGGNSSIAEAAVSIAYEKRDLAIGNDGTPLYKQVKAEVTGETSQYFRSCDRVVCTAVRWAGADDSFPLGPCGTQSNHMNSSSKWMKVTGISGEGDLQPGDILNCSGHTIVYVGNAEVRKKYPNSDANLVMGSLNNPYSRARSAACQYDKIKGNGSTVTLLYDGRKYNVYRNVKKEDSSRYSSVAGGSSSSGDSGSIGDVSGINFDSGKKGTYQKYAYSLFSKYGWSKKDMNNLIKLWNKESGWNPKAKNSSSGAYGIPQSLPGNKMASEGSDWKTNYKTQIKWGLKYIKNRYGTPSKAWKHSQDNNWY